MVRWSAVPIAILMAALFAGCIGVDDNTTAPGVGDDETPPVQPDEPTGGDNQTGEKDEPGLQLLSFTATGCNAVVLLSVDDYNDIDNFLPAGFTPADVFSLMRVQEDPDAFAGKGVMGPVTVTCADNTLTERAFSLVLPGTLVYTPSALESHLPGPSWVDGYEAFVAVDDPELADIMESYGWDVERNITIDLAVLADEDSHTETGQTRLPGASVGQVSASWDGDALFSGLVAGSVTYHTNNQRTDMMLPGEESPSQVVDKIRFWHDTAEGASYLENVVSKHGKSGKASCMYTPDTRWSQTFERMSCEEDSSIAIVVADFELQTTLVRLDGLHA